MDTIYALATAEGKAGVSVIRISGPDAWAAASSMMSRVPPPRQAAVRNLRNGQGEKLDEALVLCFEDGASFTGEKVVELQCHGSLAVVAAVKSHLSGVPGLRLAEPGEFTRRALENGRLNLTQVEGLADLIDAETDSQRRQAERVFQGDLGARVTGWRTDLIRAAALLEATIDFADEDVPEDVSGEVSALLEGVQGAVSKQLAGAHAAERVRSGFEVAILGRPNVGKSTLLNAIAGRSVALTSDIAGTTRDVIEVHCDLGGLAVKFLDTAGLRETTDEVEKLGVALARDRAKHADLRVFLVEDGDVSDVEPLDGDLVIGAKSDLGGPGVSGKTGEGVGDLIAEIRSRLLEEAAPASLVIRDRHREALSVALPHLDTALGLLGGGQKMYDLAAEEIRIVVRSLDVLVGKVDVEAILDEVFRSFCLGK